MTRDPKGPASPPGDPADLVADLAKAHIAARCLHVIADCGAADAVGAGGATPAEIAAHTGLDADALDRMLRLLAAHGIFARGADGRYSHSPASRLLRVRRAALAALVCAHDRHAGVLGPLHGARRNGAKRPPAARHGEPRRVFRRASRRAAIFNAAMVSKSRAVLPAVAAAYDFGSFATIADIGGGRGHLLKLILERAPSAQGILFERPHVIADTEPAPRLSLVGGDFFVDRAAGRRRSTCSWTCCTTGTTPTQRESSAPCAARPGAESRVLIVETLVPETPGPHFGKTLDIIMLAVTGGRERTEAQHAALLAAAGFELTRVLPTASQYSLVEAVAGLVRDLHAGTDDGAHFRNAVVALRKPPPETQVPPARELDERPPDERRQAVADQEVPEAVRALVEIRHRQIRQHRAPVLRAAAPDRAMREQPLVAPARSRRMSSSAGHVLRLETRRAPCRRGSSRGAARRPSASICANSGVPGYGVRMWNVAHSSRFCSIHSTVRSKTSGRS